MRERIGHYRLTSALGEGGMGVVYAARDERLDRPVAIKMIRAGGADARARERLWREARLAASINHPHVCQLYEIGEAEDDLYIAMELLEGESLAARIARAPLPLGEAVSVALGILSALEALHDRGLVHRDLKPSNVFLTPAGVKLLDFGLARPLAGSALADTALTLPGMLIGTPQYLSPEQISGDPLDGRSDLFAAGIVLYEMVTGHPPFTGAALPQVLHAIAFETAPMLGGSPGVAVLDRVLHRALAKRPEHRYPTARAMADDLRSIRSTSESGEAPRIRPVTRLIVLPFRILRPDPETDFLAFSLADAVTSSLSGLESLVVRSTLAASRLGGETADLDAIAEKADVDVVLTGTMLRAGDRLRVTTQLVEVPGGAVLLSQTSQVPLGDIFQLQDDLTHRMVESLALPLSARDQRLLRHDVPATAKAYEFYLRANQLAYEASNWSVARDLYLQCVQEDPQFAPAWARLGRIYRVLGMSGGEQADEQFDRAREAFTRALQLNPELSLAHNLYTNLEVEEGRAEDAMRRLLERAARRSADPELFAGLVQACRYCGLLDASIAAYDRARRLDREIRTSVAHAYLMRGEYDRAVETSVESPPLITALALELGGRPDAALDLLRSVDVKPLPWVPRMWMLSSLAALEHRLDEARSLTREFLEKCRVRDPCAVYYVARMLALTGDPDGLVLFDQAVDGGFVCADFFARDPWFAAFRDHPIFVSALSRAEARVRSAEVVFAEAGGIQTLGVVPRRAASPSSAAS